MAHSTYLVTVTPKVETWNCREYTRTVFAKDRAAAMEDLGREFASGRPLRKSSRGTTCRVCSL